MAPQTAHQQSHPPACGDIFNNPGRWAVFLDIDGTLLEIAATPESVTVSQELVNVLCRLSHTLNGAVAIMTGRQLSDADRLLAPLRLAGSGVHGAELRMAQGGDIVTVAPSLPQDLVQDLARMVLRWPGVFTEPKGTGIAVHYRLAPSARPAIEEELHRLIGPSNDLAILNGRKVFEIVPKGHSKGVALATLAASPAFQSRVPVMIGDDIGDEPAFSAAERLGGISLRVAGEHFSERIAQLNGPPSVFSWLKRFAENRAS